MTDIGQVARPPEPDVRVQQPDELAISGTEPGWTDEPDRATVALRAAVHGPQASRVSHELRADAIAIEVWALPP